MPNLRDIWASNMRTLMRREGINGVELGKKSGKGQKTVSNVVSPTSSIAPTLTTVEQLLKPFRIEPWTTFIPDMPESRDALQDLNNLMRIYLSLDANGRAMVLRAAELEARYREVQSGQ